MLVHMERYKGSGAGRDTGKHFPGGDGIGGCERG